MFCTVKAREILASWSAYSQNVGSPYHGFEDSHVYFDYQSFELYMQPAFSSLSSPWQRISGRLYRLYGERRDWKENGKKGRSRPSLFARIRRGQARVFLPRLLSYIRAHLPQPSLYQRPRRPRFAPRSLFVLFLFYPVFKSFFEQGAYLRLSLRRRRSCLTPFFPFPSLPDSSLRRQEHLSLVFSSNYTIFTMKFSFAVIPAFVAAASAVTHTVLVGSNQGLTYNPSSITAAEGDVIAFQL